MSFQYIRDYYQVPARRGAMIQHKVYGRGKIVSATNYIHVRFVSSPNQKLRSGIFHPTDENITYLIQDKHGVWRTPEEIPNE